MKKLSLVLACLFLLGLMPAAMAEEAGATLVSDMLTYTLAEDGKTLEVVLTGNATTGYTWTWTVSEEDIVTGEEGEYIPDAVEAGLAGGGGAYPFTFAPVDGAQGGVVLTFSYGREWEEAVDTVYEVALEIDGGVFTSVEAIQALPLPLTVGDIIVCPECGEEKAEVTEIIYQGDEEVGVHPLVTVVCSACGVESDFYADELPEE